LELPDGLPPFIEEGEDLDPSVSAARIEWGTMTTRHRGEAWKWRIQWRIRAALDFDEFSTAINLVAIAGL
jgi:hypothetical protein